MHRTDVRDETGKLWYVFHNGDWSGTAYIQGADAAGNMDTRIEVPGWVIKNACKQALAAELAGVLETAIDTWARK